MDKEQKPDLIELPEPVGNIILRAVREGEIVEVKTLGGSLYHYTDVCKLLRPLQEKNKRLKENYDHSQRVLDSYRKLLEEEKSRTEELEKLLKLERQSNPNKAPF